MKYIIWLGTLVDQDKIEQFSAISPAGNKWQIRFINALNSNSEFKVVCFGHRNERAYPKGKLFVGLNLESRPKEILQIRVPFINIPYLRVFIINLFILFRVIYFILKNREKIHSVFSYNLYSYNFSIPLVCKYVFKIKWFSIIADPINEYSDKINPLFRHTNGAIFLSKQLYLKSKINHKIHIEGGIQPIYDFHNQDDVSNKYILYTGKVSLNNGIFLLLDAFELIKDSSIRLIITGICTCTDFDKRIKGNSKIIYLGTIPDKELSNLYKNASILINPRLISEKTNESIFPSKLLDYLSYGKPVISTFTKGIGDEYKEVVSFIYRDSAEEMANEINNILKWSEERAIKHRLKIHDFISNSKTWSHVVRRTIIWMAEFKV